MLYVSIYLESKAYSDKLKFILTLRFSFTQIVSGLGCSFASSSSIDDI